ncbi:centrosomal protein CCDC61 isoform X2 [Denticeps clupeoides]|uniref:centrosomal protein CCDC61 isoform X2 n=1 Tax=Denticeps clupeoides TaxID=299321 RepID=UPI0010A49B04|nr:coiled-coil domain-containing protein 61 isoform X2 [Denticeps clupeoides]
MARNAQHLPTIVTKKNMSRNSVVQEDMKFRGVDFCVRVEQQEELLTVEVSDVITADQWRAQFDPAYIEDLTRKTGNFKQFPIFCSMLESAVRKTSESVTLDLLTYADLELLRNRKAGVGGKLHGHQQPSGLSAKRYLILIYTVEFDRIHYPLPLPYLGKPDPAVLQKEIRLLRAELSALGERGDPRPSDHDLCRLRAELALVREEKEALAEALERLQVMGIRSSPGLARGLQETVRSLEEQLLRERAKTQRSASKRGQEQRLLIEQLEELRASERALRIRVKSLTNELALFRRGRMTPVLTGHSGSRDREFHRSSSRERSSISRVVVRGRSGSRECLEDHRRRSEDRGRRADSSGSRAPRFDPTAYVQDQQRRQREADLKNQRKVRRDMLVSSSLVERGRSRCRELCPQAVRAGNKGRGRSVSVESRRSQRSSESSVIELDEPLKPLTSRGRKLLTNGPAMPKGRHLSRKPMCSTPTRRTRPVDQECSMDTGADLSEIDARLQALQDYMRDLDTGH